MGKPPPKGGWKKEYFRRHLSDDDHIAAVKAIPQLQKEAQRVILQSSSDQVLPLIMNVYRLAKEHVALLKSQSLYK